MRFHETRKRSSSLTVVEMVTIDTISVQSDGDDRRCISDEAGKYRDLEHPARLTRAIGALMTSLALWCRKRRSRLTLADLDDRLLQDVGLTQSEAQAELRKSIYLF